MRHEYRQNENLKVFDVTKRKLFPPVFYSFYNNRDIREAIVPRWKCLYKNNIFCCAMFQITSINMASVATHNDTFWHYIACDMMCFFFQTHSKGFQIFSKVVQNQSILHCVRGGGNLIPSVIYYSFVIIIDNNCFYINYVCLNLQKQHTPDKNSFESKFFGPS